MEPLILAVVSLWTGFLASGVVRLYRGRGLVKKNYRGRPVAPALGPVLIIGYLPAVVLTAWTGQETGLMLSANLVFWGVALSGLWDDLLEDEVSGFQGHLRSGFQGRITSGLLKIMVITLASAVFCGLLETSFLCKAIALLLLITATNGLNLLDRRPGRALKIFFVGSLLLLFISPLPETLRLLLPWLVVALVVAPWDLDAEGMLGDCGANLLGAVLGVGAVIALPVHSQLWFLLFWLGVNLCSEVVSFSTLIERTPWLRYLDLLGRSREKIS